MGVAVLNPQDCLKQPFSHMKYPRNPSACPKKNNHRHNNNNNTRRSPPRNHNHQSARCTPPPPAAPPLPPPRSTTVKKNPAAAVVGQIRILKRGEEIQIPKKKTTDLVVENSDLGSTKRIGPDPGLIPSQIRLSNRKSKKTAPFYAGPVTMTSPPPSDVPLPAFFTTNSVLTNGLKRLLNVGAVEV